MTLIFILLLVHFVLMKLFSKELFIMNLNQEPVLEMKLVFLQIQPVGLQSRIVVDFMTVLKEIVDVEQMDIH